MIPFASVGRVVCRVGFCFCLTSTGFLETAAHNTALALTEKADGLTFFVLETCMVPRVLSFTALLLLGLPLAGCHSGSYDGRSRSTCRGVPPHGTMSPGPGMTGPNGMGGLGGSGSTEHGPRRHTDRNCRVQ
ncbi:hypothetical protein FOH24_11680 [Acetobacter tropicalis]|uniref:Uncharacterized protein n=2 Tax=Acetobacter tropicalis TaxID=104102 RepID=A0A094ZSK2_9PROT|nr:hypothetical protein [Acetobacter tropicalis]KAA8385754.1 hypothetical protein FOH22_12905 [Acetobacter tropicalis]KAA8388966.1 hypothetical protein FOH24_11680 [Acetobacter tropicalis]KGB25141.1 hypothetical protein AtDm6_0822 [Acetobacter tropicalis]KXV58837.1 hypothetical protein AD947_05300 [Acetobacter tropicalis]MBC9007492.1 hypothetical protein [Acetobacter tropicalis]